MLGEFTKLRLCVFTVNTGTLGRGANLSFSIGGAKFVQPFKNQVPRRDMVTGFSVDVYIDVYVCVSECVCV